jgi:hypothetical protein
VGGQCWRFESRTEAAPERSDRGRQRFVWWATLLPVVTRGQQKAVWPGRRGPCSGKRRDDSKVRECASDRAPGHSTAKADLAEWGLYGCQLATDSTASAYETVPTTVLRRVIMLQKAWSAPMVARGRAPGEPTGSPHQFHPSILRLWQKLEWAIIQSPLCEF